jgi:hypothetical protein
MDKMRMIACGAVTAAVLSVLVGCGAGAQSQSEVNPGSSDTSSSSVDGGTGSGDNASSGDSGGPAPDNGGNNAGPSLDVAKLPVGGAPDSPDPATPDRQCANIAWAASGSDQLDGSVDVAVTAVTPFPSEIFSNVGDTCGQGPPCVGFVFNGAHSSCTQLVEADLDAVSSAAAAGSEVSGYVQISGHIICHTTAERCAEFKATAEQETQTAASLVVPQPPDESAGDGSAGEGGSSDEDASPDD